MLFFLPLNRVSTIILACLGRVSSARLLVKQLPRPRRLVAREKTEILKHNAFSTNWARITKKGNIYHYKQS